MLGSCEILNINVIINMGGLCQKMHMAFILMQSKHQILVTYARWGPLLLLDLHVTKWQFNLQSRNQNQNINNKCTIFNGSVLCNFHESYVHFFIICYIVIFQVEPWFSYYINHGSVLCIFVWTLLTINVDKFYHNFYHNWNIT